ncbi:hypothetical protein CU097_004631 [Rhizopus azygosporus]|uniref:Uncharacterized protein n=1 Tax=Rhizopus azygosporus TaxID=86630 RepID=A0A367IVI6_RHIAZ|nr:hypothetical protein CU097_004631 [Rhizopus azygosporus]
MGTENDASTVQMEITDIWPTTTYGMDRTDKTLSQLAMYGYASLESKKAAAGLQLSLGEESKDSTTLTLESTKGTIDIKFFSKAKYRSRFCIVRKLKGFFRQHYWH